MATYTQITRNEDGEYIRELKSYNRHHAKTPPANTVYLVEYATIATYFKVKADNYEEAYDKMYDDGVESVEHPDRFDVIVDETYDNGELMDNAIEKQLWRKMVANSRHGA